MVKNLGANAGETRDTGSIPGAGGSPGEGNGNLLHYSCLENSMEGGTWWATVHGVAELDTTDRLSTAQVIGEGSPDTKNTSAGKIWERRKEPSNLEGVRIQFQNPTFPLK